jgi:hypothetical protein
VTVKPQTARAHDIAAPLLALAADAIEQAVQQ